MPLKDKNGKPYRTFSQPNPLLMQQEHAQKEELVFHNFDWKPIVDDPKSATTITKNEPKKIELPKEVNPPKEVQEEKTEIVEDFFELLKKEAVSLKKEKPPEPPKQTKETEYLVLTHCWPAVIREYVDADYGESKKTIQFNSKFTFEALIVNSSDLEICLFTKDANITKGSVVYPSKYKYINERLDYCRWWQINQIEPFRDGFLLYGEITNRQADFSD